MFPKYSRYEMHKLLAEIIIWRGVAAIKLKKINLNPNLFNLHRQVIVSDVFVSRCLLSASGLSPPNDRPR
jgi:hypothetical protein